MRTLTQAEQLAISGGFIDILAIEFKMGVYLTVAFFVGMGSYLSYQYLNQLPLPVMPKNE
ncbi:MAG: hypothetical protein AB7V32_06345 [Candidatus Berkiella sp.]